MRRSKPNYKSRGQAQNTNRLRRSALNAIRPGECTGIPQQHRWGQPDLHIRAASQSSRRVRLTARHHSIGEGKKQKMLCTQKRIQLQGEVGMEMEVGRRSNVGAAVWAGEGERGGGAPVHEDYTDRLICKTGRNGKPQIAGSKFTFSAYRLRVGFVHLIPYVQAHCSISAQ
jgi:hypothetical protein